MKLRGRRYGLAISLVLILCVVASTLIYGSVMQWRFSTPVQKCACNGTGCPDCEPDEWEPIAIDELPREFREEMEGDQRDLLDAIRETLEAKL